MFIDITLLKNIDWWNDEHINFGNIDIDIVDTNINMAYDYGVNPWDIAYRNITQDLYGAFPIAMQINYVDPTDRLRQKQLKQKTRRVTISYDPHFPLIIDADEEPKEVIDIPIPTKKQKRRKHGI